MAKKKTPRKEAAPEVKPLSDERFRINVEALASSGCSHTDLVAYLHHTVAGRDLLKEREEYQVEQLAEETRRKSRDGGIVHGGVRTTADFATAEGANVE